MTIPSHLFILTGHSRGLGLAGRRNSSCNLATPWWVAATPATPCSRPPGAHLEQWQLDLADGTQAAERLHHWLLQQAPGRYASASLINNAGSFHIAPWSGLHGAQALAEQAHCVWAWKRRCCCARCSCRPRAPGRCRAGAEHFFWPGRRPRG